METLSWERLQDHIGKETPALVSMGGSRGVEIGFEPKSTRLFVRMPLEAGAVLPASPYSELLLEERVKGQHTFLEICVRSSHLYREFHRLAGLLTEELESPGQTTVGAFLGVVDRWRELTQTRRLLSDEEQLGLCGELAVVEALLVRFGSEAIKSWTARGPKVQERHDFRIDRVDLEVKSTRMSRRQHVVHGLKQLEPSAGHDLFIVSLRFEAAGMANGRSLVQRVQSIRIALADSPQALADFENKLGAADYRDADAAHYQEKLIFADVPMLIRVDAACPRLVRTQIQSLLGTDLAARIGNDITYRIDVEGLGEPLDAASPGKSFAPLNVE